MFVQCTRVVPVPLPVAQHRLRKYLNLSGDLGGDAVAAIREGQNQLDAGVGWLHKQVLVQSLRPYADGDATVVPFRWVASGSLTSLLPIMDANVELRPEDSSSSRLTLKGTYRPPLGKVGAAIDRAVLHRVAQATADSFLSKVERGLVGPSAAADLAAQSEQSTQSAQSAPHRLLEPRPDPAGA